MSNVNIKNKKAFFEFHILAKYSAGIALLGTEIKSIRNNNANLSDAFCTFNNSELYIKNLHIGELQNAGLNNHTPKRDRKLLLNRLELNKIESKVKEKGITIIPLRLFINKNGKAKIEIALSKGKKLFDKRESIKEKDIKRDINRSQILK